MIFSDRGNAEQMWKFVNNIPDTSHTLNLVEVFVVGDGFAAGTRRGLPLLSGQIHPAHGAS